MRSPEYNPVGTHLPSIRPPDGRYRRSVVEERGEARATQSSVLAGDGLLGEPPNVPKYPLSPLTVPNSGKSNVQFYPAGTYLAPQAAIT